MKTLRIFISSPGDVAEERDRAKQVVESLRRRYAGKFILKPLLWEELPLQPDMSFQQGIDMVLSQDRGLEIAVFILWSRLGTPLGKTIPRPDGGEYRSGTEREFDLMMQARKQSGGQRPHVLVYTRRDETSFDERLRGKSTDEKKDLLSQKERVEGFIKEEFHDSETGLNRSAYHSFDRPVTFSQRLRTHLQEVLDELAGGSAEVIWDTEKQGPPFMGLEAFQPQHADVFFGREEEILEARHALREQARNGCAFLLLSGASGSGKSSLARAGILPAICDLEVDEQVASWRTTIVTPADLAPDPFIALVTRLADALPVARASSPQHAQSSDLGQDARATHIVTLAADLRENPGITLRQAILPAIALASATAKGPIRLLLLIDQLEEFFASTAISAEDRAAFLAAIEALARSGSVWVLATVRSDFYQQVQSEPALIRLKSGHGQLDILPPGPDALRRLIEEPARLAGLTFEIRDGQSLADRILRDAVAHAELLPLVEFVLRELYEQRTEAAQLTFAAYDTLGGVEGALARRAEHAFLSLPAESQQCLGLVMQSLVTLGQDQERPAATDSERIVRLSAPLSAFDGDPHARYFVDTFIAERLFTSDQPIIASEALVTVAHECLLRVWRRATEWASENRDLLRVRARIAIRIIEDSPLLAGDPLLTAAQAHFRKNAAAFTPAMSDYIESCTAAAEAKSRRAIRRRTIYTVVLIVFAVFATIFAMIALKTSATAKSESRKALLAEEQSAQSLKNLKQLYNAELIRKANSLLESGQASSARKIILSIDKDHLPWSARFLKELCGPPSVSYRTLESALGISLAKNFRPSLAEVNSDEVGFPNRFISDHIKCLWSTPSGNAHGGKARIESRGGAPIANLATLPFGEFTKLHPSADGSVVSCISSGGEEYGGDSFDYSDISDPLLIPVSRSILIDHDGVSGESVVLRNYTQNCFGISKEGGGSKMILINAESFHPRQIDFKCNISRLEVDKVAIDEQTAEQLAEMESLESSSLIGLFQIGDERYLVLLADAVLRIKRLNDQKTIWMQSVCADYVSPSFVAGLLLYVDKNKQINILNTKSLESKIILGGDGRPFSSDIFSYADQTSFGISPLGTYIVAIARGSKLNVTLIWDSASGKLCASEGDFTVTDGTVREEFTAPVHLDSGIRMITWIKDETKCLMFIEKRLEYKSKFDGESMWSCEPEYIRLHMLPRLEFRLHESEGVILFGSLLIKEADGVIVLGRSWPFVVTNNWGWALVENPRLESGSRCLMLKIESSLTDDKFLRDLLWDYSAQ